LVGWFILSYDWAVFEICVKTVESTVIPKTSFVPSFYSAESEFRNSGVPECQASFNSNSQQTTLCASNHQRPVCRFVCGVVGSGIANTHFRNYTQRQQRMSKRHVLSVSVSLRSVMLTVERLVGRQVCRRRQVVDSGACTIRRIIQLRDDHGLRNLAGAKRGGARKIALI